ncbi:divalent metal cation transporter [Xylophilus rhododendri]|uniref:Divalent metal cation transporter n=1 Tax=Xylophilus rhododendri TaxID=2697032 RepID=A0A857J4B0_9BURK|nr:divalent metal cation transporter [Xylophilus rhododendri]QHI98063.1 divalent metal cation transporter [Xylophilus rhododendri]
MPHDPQPGADASPSKRPSGWLSRLGPGLITGAADDDPSGIATYSQAGAQFGLATLWTLLLTYPLMVGIQAVSARIGRVTGHGLAGNMRRHYPRWLLQATVALLLVANVANIAADLSAMGDAARLVLGGPAHLYTVLFGLVALLLQVFVPYARYVRFLKWLTLVLFAYVAVLFSLQIPWADVARATFWPRLSTDTGYVTTVVAILGTTISPYLFFWQASQEVEDMQGKRPPERSLLEAPQEAQQNFRRIRLDTGFGMAVSNAVAFFIMLTAALTLHRHGVTDIQSSAQAAEALRPIAGELAFGLFSLGIIGTGMLAIPVLAGSAAYAMAGAFGWSGSLESSLREAKAFYSIIAAAMVAGIALGFSPLDPIKALFWSAVLNGVIAVPIMVVMMLMVANRQVMGRFVASRRLKVLGWAATALMGAAVLVMLAF